MCGVRYADPIFLLAPVFPPCDVLPPRVRLVWPTRRSSLRIHYPQDCVSVTVWLSKCIGRNVLVDKASTLKTVIFDAKRRRTISSTTDAY
jgi:hypothetical protein